MQALRIVAPPEVEIALLAWVAGSGELSMKPVAFLNARVGGMFAQALLKLVPKLYIEKAAHFLRERRDPTCFGSGVDS